MEVKNKLTSDIKTVVDAWYKMNIVDEGYSEAVKDTIFCNDRSIPGQGATGWSEDTGLGYGGNKTAYGSTSRLGVWNSETTKTQPSFACPEKNDAFTVNDENKCNGSLTYPVGLITADEIVAAGSGKYGTSNSTYYLYNPNSFSWSLSPSYYSSSALVFGIGTYGIMCNGSVYATGAVDPVINLTPEYFKTLIGTGTMENPFRAEDLEP